MVHQKYHHHQQFIFKFKENNENDMKFQQFGPVLFSAHVYGRFQLVGSRLLVGIDFTGWDFAHVTILKLWREKSDRLVSSLA